MLITPYDNPKHSGEQREQEGVLIRNLRVPASGPFDNLLLARTLCREVDRCGAELVHVFKPKGFAGIACAHQLLKGRHSTVLDCDDWEGWGGWNEVANHSRVTKHFIDFQEKALIRRTPVVTAASVCLADRAKALRGRNNVFYLPNCLTAKRAAEDDQISAIPVEEERNRLNLPAGLIIFYAGHYGPADDVAFFCRATAPLAVSCDATVALAGSGPELERAVQQFAEHKVKTLVLGTLPFERYRRIVHASDIACFPYPDSPVYRAKCSARILDYMSLAKPILTSALGQNREYLKHGESAMLVSPGNQDEYQRALQSLLEDPRRRQKLGQAAQRTARKSFQWDGFALQNCLSAYAAAA